MTDAERIVREQLFAMQDVEYKDFYSKLIPTVDSDKIIGIRVPVLRRFAKDLYNQTTGEQFIKNLPHKFYEENNVHAFIIEQIKDFDTALIETEKFLPYIDNWATCDMFSPKVFSQNTEIIFNKSVEWIGSGKTYIVRYGIGMLMRYFLDDMFTTDILELVAAVKSDEYYVNMMIAWFFATALAKQYDEAVKFIKTYILKPWVHNKTIQKAFESNRISAETKLYLKSLRIRTE